MCLVIVRFRYPDNKMFEGPYQLHLAFFPIWHIKGDRRGDERYVERIHLYIGEERLYEGKMDGVSSIDVWVDTKAYFMMSLYHPSEMQATNQTAWGETYYCAPLMDKMRSIYYSSHN